MDVFVAEVALGSMLIIETKLAGGVLAPRRSAFAAVRGGRRLHEALMPVEGNSCDRDVCVINSGSFGASPWPCPKKKKGIIWIGSCTRCEGCRRSREFGLLRRSAQVVDDVVLPRAASAYSPQTRPSLAAELLAEVRGHHEDPEPPPLMILGQFMRRFA